ncbi:uncharacterized protein Pyn_08461 [Prunus yedoensis var. nudiflora]|uniref:Uncharacterized protein n=1 Tax=Prunus yedoensis var. nudiflora TaxID=2094558 RepID=A0A314YLQ4_PRUYE|nr:uncharacterized protein Pyn_08461 [Prunus yedoensis var. nudiflora]
MGDSSASYIHMVHHLIEECIIFNMSKEECMEALSKHANIKTPSLPLQRYKRLEHKISVWKELEKENKEFFEAYTKNREARASETEITKQRIEKMLFDLSQEDSSDDDDDE